MHQYYRLQDNLADVLLAVAQSHQNSSAREHRDWCYENRKMRDCSLKTLLDLLDDSIFNVISDIRIALGNRGTTDAEKVAHIEELLRIPKNAVEKTAELKTSLEQIGNDRHYFEIMERRSLKLQNRLSPTVKALDFQGEPGSAALMEAIAFKKKRWERHPICAA